MENLKKSTVLVLGYDLSLTGGVTKVTRMLLDNMEELELHPVLYCYSPRYLSLFKSITSYFSFLAKILIFHKHYRIIHVIMGSPGDAIRTVPFIFTACVLGKPVCIQHHANTGFILDRLPRWIKFITRYAWRCADLHIFLSKRLHEIYKEYIHDDPDVAIIPNPLEKEWLDLPVPGLDARKRDIVFFGRWSREKGVFDLVDAVNNCEGITCEIYTNSNFDREIGRCRIFPWVEERKVREILLSAKILALPSYHEAYPMVLLEAMACGTPFIATNVGGIPDIVNQAYTGFTMDPGDIRMLVSYINILAYDPELWNKYSIRGKDWVKCLNIESTIVSMRRAYFKALDSMD